MHGLAVAEKVPEEQLAVSAGVAIAGDVAVVAPVKVIVGLSVELPRVMEETAVVVPRTAWKNTFSALFASLRKVQLKRVPEVL
jgi:hypothetical protein